MLTLSSMKYYSLDSFGFGGGGGGGVWPPIENQLPLLSSLTKFGVCIGLWLMYELFWISVLKIKSIP